MNKKINLFLCDDHLIFVKGLKHLLEEDNRIKVVGFSLTLEGVKHFIELKKDEIDILLLDIKIQDNSGFELAKWMKLSNLNIKVVFLTMFDDIETINKAMELGCSGYLHKNIDPEELFLAIKTVANDVNYFPITIYKKIANQSIKNKDNENEKSINLSEREMQILTLIVKGQNTIQMSESLFISTHTINTYRKSLFKKFEVNNMASLVAKAIRNQMI